MSGYNYIRVADTTATPNKVEQRHIKRKDKKINFAWNNEKSVTKCIYILLIISNWKEYGSYLNLTFKHISDK